VDAAKFFDGCTEMLIEIIQEAAPSRLIAFDDRIPLINGVLLESGQAVLNITEPALLFVRRQQSVRVLPDPLPHFRVSRPWLVEAVRRLD
jgi:hypothetical protein